MRGSAKLAWIQCFSCKLKICWMHNFWLVHEFCRLLMAKTRKSMDFVKLSMKSVFAMVLTNRAFQHSGLQTDGSLGQYLRRHRNKLITWRNNCRFVSQNFSGGWILATEIYSSEPSWALLAGSRSSSETESDPVDVSVSVEAMLFSCWSVSFDNSSRENL